MLNQNVTIGDMFKPIASAFLNLLYPKNCHVCSSLFDRHTPAYDDYICFECFSSMKRTSPAESYAPISEKKDSAYERLLTCYLYEGAVRELVHKFKYENRPYLSKTITKLMSEFLNEAGAALFETIDCFVPVPLHPARLREREFNQSELLAGILGACYNKPSVSHLKRLRNTHSQASLTEHERQTNIQGAFALNNLSVKDKNILLIDDVVTTSATVEEASRTLKKSGAKNVWVLAFAKG